MYFMTVVTNSPLRNGTAQQYRRSRFPQQAYTVAHIIYANLQLFRKFLTFMKHENVKRYHFCPPKKYNRIKL